MVLHPLQVLGWSSKLPSLKLCQEAAQKERSSSSNRGTLLRWGPKNQRHSLLEGSSLDSVQCLTMAYPWKTPPIGTSGFYSHPFPSMAFLWGDDPNWQNPRAHPPSMRGISSHLKTTQLGQSHHWRRSKPRTSAAQTNGRITSKCLMRKTLKSIEMHCYDLLKSHVRINMI